ncbi:hypothetical protein [Piscinibacter sp.]|jgi:hypothetical protein|uniref:hypothetical protein n=1 Tax=Piscinibacter sp. TaxID=1903157 RepID=UPI003559D098
MLVVWLFALVTGVVNACTVAPEFRHNTSSQAHQQHDPMAAHANERSSPLGHDEGALHAGNASCAKFCEQPSTTAQVLKQQTDVFAVLGLPAVPGHGLRFDATADVASAVAVEGTLRPAAIPIPIAFLRLAL